MLTTKLHKIKQVLGTAKTVLHTPSIAASYVDKNQPLKIFSFKKYNCEFLILQDIGWGTRYNSEIMEKLHH